MNRCDPAHTWKTPLKSRYDSQTKYWPVTHLQHKQNCRRIKKRHLRTGNFFLNKHECVMTWTIFTKITCLVNVIFHIMSEVTKNNYGTEIEPISSGWNWSQRQEHENKSMLAKNWVSCVPSEYQQQVIHTKYHRNMHHNN